LFVANPTADWNGGSLPLPGKSLNGINHPKRVPSGKVTVVTGVRGNYTTMLRMRRWWSHTSFSLAVGLVESIGDCKGVRLLVVVAAVFEVGVVGVAA
jgi:hypothetical protein